MAKDIMRVEILDNNTTVGVISTEEFRSYFGVKNVFLQELIDTYNKAHEIAKSPMRARIQLVN